jgi:glucose/arabinose dehydrogenase
MDPRNSLTACALLALLLAACAPVSLPPPQFTPSSTQVLPTTIPSTETPVPPMPTETAAPTATPVTFLSAFPDPAGYAWSEIVSGLDQPVDIQNAGDGSGRLFVVERSGRIRVLQNGQLQPLPFLDLSGRVSTTGLEQGLLGLAFHPDFVDNGFFYVNFTDAAGNTVVARFTAPPGDPQQADPSSEFDMLYILQPYQNHNGGGLAFGPDGYLYIGLGDGGSGGDPLGNGQSLNTLLGKLLRIGVDNANPYAIPADNPYVNGGGLPEIWASGLRNPWRFSFDPATGDLYIADVGQGDWEEIDFLPAGTTGGVNLGWNYYEGLHTFEGQPQDGSVFTFPVAEYPHSALFNGQIGGCSVTGGHVYRGAALPEWQGVYFFGDYCNGRVFGLVRSDAQNWQTAFLFESGASLSSFGVDEAGELYLADFANGRVLRLERR